MTNANFSSSSDWTGLLSDPDLLKNLGKLLQIYREAPPERRNEALLEAVREIKESSKPSDRKVGPAEGCTAAADELRFLDGQFTHGG